MIPNLRVRLTAIYGGIFVVFVAVLLSISYWLMARHLDRTLGVEGAATALEQLRLQYLMALAGASLVATALGWALAGRELASMQAAFDARERFVANASHELRSPLTVIRTEADVTLADPDATVEELRSMGYEVLGAADEMEALLDGLMVLARSGRELPNREYVDLAAATHAAARRVRAGGVRVRLELAPAGVSGERRLLERLAGNLIENGVRYNAPGGFVAVRTSAVEGGAVLDVVNSGPVIDPVLAARLVEPFERGGRTGRGGAGLGLSIVRSVAEAHGGRLALTPRAEGGLAVRVTLPSA
ncbi:sensor histidine kinase [Solirubrobacter soli]|uniref:sensor histidine kinase n=1 Tax=Solirubrobacter soli TaxID=363832 RepID=UPI00040B1632|nr:HAMP domain-containing sensor histidine kinase [Solirubrobacter soli]